MSDRDTLADKVNGLDVNDWFKIAVAKEQENDALHTEIAELQSRASMSDRGQLWQLMHEHVDYRDHSHDAAVDAILANGWRPPARKISDPAELDALPGRSIVVGHRGKFGTAYQLTSYVGFAQTPMWAGPYDVEKRSTSREVIEREGGVTVLHEPTEEDGQ